MRVHCASTASAAGRLATACLLFACTRPTATDPLPTTLAPPVAPTDGLDDKGGIYLQEAALDGGSGEGNEDSSSAAIEAVIGVVVLAVAIALLALAKHRLARDRESRIRGEIVRSFLALNSGITAPPPSPSLSRRPASLGSAVARIDIDDNLPPSPLAPLPHPTPLAAHARPIDPNRPRR